jgi:hypothetical protein
LVRPGQVSRKRDRQFGNSYGSQQPSRTEPSGRFSPRSSARWMCRGQFGRFRLLNANWPSNVVHALHSRARRRIFRMDGRSTGVTSMKSQSRLTKSKLRRTRKGLVYAKLDPRGLSVIASDLQHGKPVFNPPRIQSFTAVQGAMLDPLRITNPSALTVECNDSNHSGLR